MTKHDGKTPYELDFKHPPYVGHLRRPFCPVFAVLVKDQRPTPRAFADRVARCVFVGYPLDQKPGTYLLCNLETKRLITSRNVYFDERNFASSSALPAPTARPRGSSSSTQTRPPSSRSSRTPTATRSRTLPLSPGTSSNQWEFLPSVKQWESVGRWEKRTTVRPTRRTPLSRQRPLHSRLLNSLPRTRTSTSSRTRNVPEQHRAIASRSTSRPAP